MHLLHDGEIRVIHVELACRIGEAEAQFIGQLHYWLKTSKHEVNGRKWVYNTVSEWREQFPYWSKRKMETVLKSCRVQGLVSVGEYNKHKQDRTKWYSINYNHPKFSEGHTAESADSHTAISADSDTAECADSNHKNTHEIKQKITEISPKAKTVMQIAAEQNLGTPDKPNGFDFQETQVLDEVMENRQHGSVISVWWRKCMRGYGHVNHVLPELTGKDQKQLMTLIKQLGPTGPLRIMLALRFWPEYKKYANAEFGLKSTVKPVIQKFVLGRNAIAGFEPPKEVDYTEKDWKSL
jgi:hypothetical protein